MQDAPTLTAGDVIPDAERSPGDWLSPAAAASRLGVSERTLWRLVKAGRYHRRVTDRKAMILVPVPDASVTPDSLPDSVMAEVSGRLSGVTDEELQR